MLGSEHQLIANLENVLVCDGGTDDSLSSQGAHGLKHQVRTDGVSTIAKQDTHVVHLPVGQVMM